MTGSRAKRDMLSAEYTLIRLRLEAVHGLIDSFPDLAVERAVLSIQQDKLSVLLYEYVVEDSK